MATSTFSAKITNLVGGTIDDDACDDWMTEGAKEIINQLPANIKAKCSTISIINATNGTTLDLDGKGSILNVTRLSADSGGYYIPCREVEAKYGDLTNDSTDITHYATVTDPAFWITSNSSDVATLFVKPTPTDAQPANAYHVTYPTVDNGTDNTIANFPDEAEYLVVLYAAIRQLLQYQSTMSSSFNTDIGTAFTQAKQGLANAGVEIGLANKEVDDALIEIDEAVGLTDGSGSNIQVALDAMATANAKFRADGSDPALFGDESTYTTGSSAMTNVKTYVDRAVSYINGDFPEADSDLVQYLKDINDQVTAEDTELAASFIQAAQTTMNAINTDLQIAQTYITEWNAMVQTLVSEVNSFASEASARYGWMNAKAVVWQGELSAAQGYMATANGYIGQTNGFLAEASGRLAADSAKYSWYGDQYAKLTAEYVRGLTALKGG